ncbi:MAG TPA: hypothetical protein PLP14_00220 [Chitinophagaceae bacterium]|nr:hypothetical protein [Chitinophagaceae bacterium]
MRTLLLSMLCLWFTTVSAQTLEEVNFSPNSSILLDTYTTGINDSGFVCGYYLTVSGNKIGYVINALGKAIVLYPGTISASFTDVSVEGINDSCTILLNCINGSGNIEIWKGYYNHDLQTYVTVAVAGNGQPNVAKPFAINNHNVYTGWYPNLTDRWCFTLNDSTVSSLPVWNAKRYGSGFPITYYPTYMLGNNDNDLQCGYYIDGINYPMVYNAPANTFDPLPFSNNMKLHDINNSNKVVGEYKLAGGYYCGFYGDYSTGSITNVVNINSLFTATNVQNVLNGINDKGEMVGSYLHPVSSKWIGFIYRPAQNEYRLPDFSYATDTWSIPNNNVNMSTDIWTPNYYGNFNYSSVDPYAWNGFPLLNPVVQAQHPTIPSVANSQAVSWKGYMHEDIAATLSAIPNVAFYENNLKPLLFTKYWNKYKQVFTGYCFGFSYTTLLRKYREPDFVAWYNMNTGTNISTVPNTDTNAILAIERTYLKQYDPSWGSIMFPITTSYWSGLFRLKNNMNLDAAHTNPQSVGIGLNPSGGHNLLPYKIRTPKTLPFDVPTQLYDTLFVYDSSNPNDSTQKFIILDPYVGTQGQGAGNTSWPNMYELRFQKVALHDLVYTQYSALKHTRSQNDSLFEFSLRENLYYNLYNSSSDLMKTDASGFSNACSNIYAALSEEVNSAIPLFYKSDTQSVFNFHTYHYQDTVMMWNVNKNYLCFGLSRKAQLNEQDNSSIGHRQLSYGNPDPVNKKLNAYFVEVKDDGTQANTVLINDLDMNTGDSLLTENPSPYIYRITRFSPNADTYNISTYTFFNDTARQFQANNISIHGNESHTIDALYGGTQTVIFVDNGLNGSNDDTLFVQEVPLSVLAPLHSGKMYTLYPVPAQQELTLDLHEKRNETLQTCIAAIDGRIVQRNTFAADQQSTQCKLDIAALQTGQYVLFVLGAKGELVFREAFSKQ